MTALVHRSVILALVACGGLEAAGAQVTSQVAVTRAAPDSSSPATKPKVANNALPSVEIAGFLVLLNVFDRVVLRSTMENGTPVYASTFASTWDHLRTQRWEHDPDSFRVNQFGHPYQGAMMFGLSRSTGHGFWTSLLHADVGSFVWEMAGETVPPSIDDLITTSQAGSLFGEALYRMADLVLADGGRYKPNRLHEYAATLIAPWAGFNRRLFGDRFASARPAKLPAAFWQFKVGATLDALARDYASPRTLLQHDATAEFSMSYGLPGQPGYAYTKPLDYFDMQLSVLSSASNPIESLLVRGLLIGAKTADTERSRGIWGLYGSYDYISPYLFRVSSTALSIGTTRQYSLTPSVALQGSALAGIGYGAAGSRTVIASTPTSVEIRDYHRGITPQGLLALNVIGGDRAKVSFAAREYYVSGRGSDDAQGSETIFRGIAGLTLRLFGGHAVGAQYASSRRTARYGKQPNVKLAEGTLTLSYSILGGNGLGAVKW